MNTFSHEFNCMRIDNPFCHNPRNSPKQYFDIWFIQDEETNLIIFETQFNVYISFWLFTLFFFFID